MEKKQEYNRLIHNFKSKLQQGLAALILHKVCCKSKSVSCYRMNDFLFVTISKARISCADPPLGMLQIKILSMLPHEGFFVCHKFKSKLLICSKQKIPSNFV